MASKPKTTAPAARHQTVRHGVDPLDTAKVIDEMGTEAAKELGGPVRLLGTSTTHDPESNEKEDHGEDHLTVKATWERAPAAPAT